MSDIILPHNWVARDHQTPFMKYMFEGGTTDQKRAALVWHRRAGKDSSALNFEAVEAHNHVANYWHMLPTSLQGRQVIWEAVNPHTGQRVIDQAFPKELRASVNNTDMMIKLKNGSTWQVVGSDNYDRLVGSNPRGVVFSEWSLANPAAWDYIRPILVENGGWAIFIYTPRGKNHGFDTYQMAKDNPNWFCELLSIDNTKRNDGSPIVTLEQYQEEIDSGMDPLMARQEYYCSFDAGLMGSYYTDQLKQSKIGDYPWNPAKPVHTFWDIGMKDSTAIWYGQEGQGDAINIIDYEEASNTDLPAWIGVCREKPYNYGVNSKPHDFFRRNWSDSTRSSQAVADSLGWEVEETPNVPRNQGIDAVKMFLPRLRFNNTPQVMKGYDALANYRREYNQKLRVFMDRPLHDWASNGADAMRYMALAWPDNYGMFQNQTIRVKSSNGRTRVHKLGARHG